MNLRYLRIVALFLVGLQLAVPAAGAAPTGEFDAWRGRLIQEIRFEGNRVTRDYVIAREILSEEGAPLDPDLLRQDVSRLENLSIFGSVDVTIVEGPEGVVLDFVFSEMPSLLPFPAVTWNEQNGFSVGAGLTSPNFTGRGVSLSARAVFGGTTNYNFRALHPWLAGDHLSLELLVYHNERRNLLLEFDETTDRVEASIGYYLGRNGRVKGNIGYWGVGSDRDGITLDADRHDDILLLGASLGYDSRDSWRVPHRGWRAELSSDWLGGTAATQTTTLDVRRYQPVRDGHTLAFGPLVSAQTGVVGSEIPSYQQYFLGGVNSVRGYDLIELGQKINGKNRLLFSAEYRYLAVPVRGLAVFRWSVALGLELAAFGDLGVVWNEPEQFNRDRTRFGYGVGARLLVPVVEMIRFDFGVGESGDFEFNFGVRSMFEARALPVF